MMESKTQLLYNHIFIFWVCPILAVFALGYVISIAVKAINVMNIKNEDSFKEQLIDGIVLYMKESVDDRTSINHIFKVLQVKKDRYLDLELEGFRTILRCCKIQYSILTHRNATTEEIYDMLDKHASKLIEQRDSLKLLQKVC